MKSIKIATLVAMGFTTVAASMTIGTHMQHFPGIGMAFIMGLAIGYALIGAHVWNA